MRGLAHQQSRNLSLTPETVANRMLQHVFAPSDGTGGAPVDTADKATTSSFPSCASRHRICISFPVVAYLSFLPPFSIIITKCRPMTKHF